MKEINVYVRSNDLTKITDILLKHKAGVTFFDIQGTGRTPRSTTEVIHSYHTGRTTVPKFIGRTLVLSIVSDTLAPQIVKEIIDNFDLKEEPYGVLFVKDVTDAYELGTVVKGDEVLISK
jgi:nitrogen regulatory protein P-II 1